MWSFVRPGAVLALALFMFCSESADARGQQSERNRQRSGPIRSIPVGAGAGAKRDTEFDCPEEFGYYPHPSDCSQYYVCVFGGALLESCTGGLMYSHELQTCDWPRNVGCDATSAGAAESEERADGRQPLPPPRRAPPPPPPRVQPNPVVTSRGQPRISQDEYAKRQQLYSDFDELPPAEEIESDRPQRVYRGQPSTIGQVQRDRDGYSSQINSGRSLNANIIPASISQTSGKIGAFSFGTQVDQRRTASPTQEPQSYSGELKATDITDRPKDFKTNCIDGQNQDSKLLRKKRDTSSNETKEIHFNGDNEESDQIDRKDRYVDESVELLETDDDEAVDKDIENDRNKRQTRHRRLQYKNVYNQNAGNTKPLKSFEHLQYSQNPSHNFYNTAFNTFNTLPYSNNGYQDVSHQSYTPENTILTTAIPYRHFQASNLRQKPFKASTPDPYNERYQFNPLNAATQIITKSPPISSLTNNENPFSALAGGFYNNNQPRQNIQLQRDGYNQNPTQSPSIFQNNYRNGNNLLHQDSSDVPTTIVTHKPIRVQSTTKGRTKYRIKPELNRDSTELNKQSTRPYTKRPDHEEKKKEGINESQHNDEKEYDEGSDEEEDDNNEDYDNDENNNKTNNDELKVPDFPGPPYELTHIKDKYEDIVNPFADPNFDFDAFISKIRDSHAGSETTSTPMKYRQPVVNSSPSTSRRPVFEDSKSQQLVTNREVSYQGMSTPRPFSIPTVSGAKSIVSWPAKSNSVSTRKPFPQNYQYEDTTIDQPTTDPNSQLQTKSPKFLKHTFEGDDNNFQISEVRPNENDNNRYRNPNPNKGNVEVFVSTNQPFTLRNKYTTENLRYPDQNHNANIQITSQNTKVPNQSKYSFNDDENTFAQIRRPNENINPRFKPPNFKDDRRLPINYNFNADVGTLLLPPPKKNIKHFRTTDGKQIVTVTQKPYITVMVTSPTPLLYATKPQSSNSINPHNFFTSRPQIILSGKTAYFTTAKPNAYNINQQYSINNLDPIKASHISSTEAPNTNDQFLQSVTSPPRSHPTSIKSYFLNSSIGDHSTSTVKPTPKRRPIPKPSPEMNDYYYDDDDEYYYEPPVKSQFMPSSEVRPQRPHIAQNDEEYDDEEYEDDSEEAIETDSKIPLKRPASYTNYQDNNKKKHYNDIAVPTKTRFQAGFSNGNGKIPVPVMMNTSPPSLLKRPQVTNYEVIHSQRNKTATRKPMHIFRESGPNTANPPKYLNQTTLRPYTVRHRLAKPTTLAMMHPTTNSKQVRGQNIRMPTTSTRDFIKSTTSHDNNNQETRFTKTRHDDRTNSLEPTESVTPAAYSPRPTAGRALYNGSQNYNPDQYDPYYALYDEDGELYKDTVQQTYRGTPPPAPVPSRRPLQEIYTARPVSADEYDDALIQGQIEEQNQYQQPIRQSTRSEGNELGYEHNPSSVRTTVYEATSISTTPSTTTSTTSTTTTTTQRPTSAPITEAMTPSRNIQRSTSDESNSRSNATATEKSSSTYPILLPTPDKILIPENISLFAKAFKRTSNSFRLKDVISSNNSQAIHRGLVSNLSLHAPKTMVTRPVTNITNNPQHFSLTTGFSIRRDPNNSQSPYTLTVITRPSITKADKLKNEKLSDNENNDLEKYFYDHIIFNETQKSRQGVESKEGPNKQNITQRRVGTEKLFLNKDIDSGYMKQDREEIIQSVNQETFKPFEINSLRSEDEVFDENKSKENGQMRVFLKTVIKRPAPFTLKKDNSDAIQQEENEDRKWLPLGEKPFEFSQTLTSSDKSIRKLYGDPMQTQSRKRIFSLGQNKSSVKSFHVVDEPTMTPYKLLESLREKNEEKDKISFKSNSSPTKNIRNQDLRYPIKNDTSSEHRLDRVQTYSTLDNSDNLQRSTEKYTTYKSLIQDATEPLNITYHTIRQIAEPSFEEAHTTEMQSQNRREEITTKNRRPHPETVNIGFQNRKHNSAKSYQEPQNNRRLQIVDNVQTSVNEEYNSRNLEVPRTFASDNIDNKFNTVILSTPQPSTHNPIVLETITGLSKTTTLKYDNVGRHEESYEYSTYTSKFDDISRKASIPKSKDNEDVSKKFQNVLNADIREIEKNSEISSNTIGTDLIRQTKTSVEPVTLIPFPGLNETFDRDEDAIVTTTQMTMKLIESTTKTAKTSPYPTRASRINPAIKLAATNPGGGRRSYQSSSKCSTDNSLQANPKCNEIQRTNTRGRGSAHYSTSSGDAPPVNNANRGTPPARLRPTLKPSTSIVSKEATFVDIYQYPPSRPPAIYPQPTPDKTAAKCRKDVCLLPDCSCGGKDIPGKLPVNEVPQLVLVTFDDAVSDLNKEYYKELFEVGRVNPNGCPIAATFYVSHEWTDYSQVQNLYADGHELASHTISHSFGEQFSQKKWNREVAGQREILSAYGGVKLEDVRGMRAPFLSVGGNKMFKMLYDSNFTYDSSMPVYENRPPSWPYTLDYKLFHDCMIPPCPTRSYPGVWEVPMVMWQDLNGGRCSMGDACSNPPTSEGVYKMLLKNFDRHYTTNRAPFGLFYHAAWFTQPHHKEGFIMFMDAVNQMKDVFFVTNWQALQWVRDPTPLSRINSFQPFNCDYPDRPKRCNNPKVCNLWHKSGVRYMRTCQPCPDVYPWTGKTGIRSSRIDNEIEE